jgi:hypothetical protein
MALIQDATGDLAFAQTLETALLNDLQANTPQGVNSKVALSIRAGDGAQIVGQGGCAVRLAHRGGGRAGGYGDRTTGRQEKASVQGHTKYSPLVFSDLRTARAKTPEGMPYSAKTPTPQKATAQPAHCAGVMRSFKNSQASTIVSNPNIDDVMAAYCASGNPPAAITQ